jgi:SAM-dependent methyltransferase
VPNWDSIFTAESMQCLTPTPQLLEIIPQLQDAGCRKVLDAGCGVGRHISPLLAAGFLVWAVDAAATVLPILRRHLEVGRLSDILPLQGDLQALPFQAGVFDAVISINVINHGNTATFNRYTAELDRVLRPGGMIFAYVSPFEFAPLVLKPETQELEAGTYVNISTPDGELVHHFPTRDELRRRFLGYTTIRQEIIDAAIPFMGGISMPQMVFWAIKGGL